MNRRELIKQAVGVTAAVAAGPLAAALPVVAEPLAGDVTGDDLVEWQLPGDPPKSSDPPKCVQMCEDWMQPKCYYCPHGPRGFPKPGQENMLPSALIIAVEREMGELG